MFRDLRSNRREERANRQRMFNKMVQDGIFIAGRLKWENNHRGKRKEEASDVVPRFSRGPFELEQLKRDQIYHLYFDEGESDMRELEGLEKPDERACLRETVKRLRDIRLYRELMKSETKCRTLTRPCFDPKVLEGDLLRQIEEKNKLKNFENKIDLAFHNIMVEGENIREQKEIEKELKKKRMEAELKDVQLGQILEHEKVLEEMREREKNSKPNIAIPVGETSTRTPLTEEEKKQQRMERLSEAADHMERSREKEKLFKAEMGCLIPPRDEAVHKSELLAKEQEYLNMLSCARRAMKIKEEKSDELIRKEADYMNNLLDERARKQKEKRQAELEARMAFVKQIVE